MFKIVDHVEFDVAGRAHCPACEVDGQKRRKSLCLIPNTDGAYKCHRGCSVTEIRDAIGQSKPKQIPAALAQAAKVAPTTVSPQKVKEAHDRLMQPSGDLARQWLNDRGISDPMIQRYQLGLVRSKQGDRMVGAISLPIPANDEGTAFHQKKRVEPWTPAAELPPEHMAWVQKGIPAKVWFTYRPAEALGTWICEGEWDAIMLGWAVRQADLPVAVVSFTCGCSAVPPDDELAKLPGDCTIFYDRNDKPRKDGTRPGEAGAQKLAKALGERGFIAAVPMPPDCRIDGWDVSDAFQQGFTIEHFIAAANSAIQFKDEPPKRDNYLRDHLIWNDELLATAPEYTDWLVPDILTTSELFLLAAGPRAGKSLLAMSLAKAVAEGSSFLGRPVLQGPVIYIRKEDNDTKTKEREMAQGWAEGLPVAWLRKFKLSDLDLLQEIAEEIQPRLIVVDTLSRVKDSSVSESSAEMSQLLEPLQELAEELDCCILLVHHTGKVSVENIGNIDVFDTIRGSSAIRATCRGSLVLAAGDRNYRLLVENGWGKHDLAVVLDANTLTWQFIGEWKPVIDGTQSDQVVAYLKNHEFATIDQMSADLNAPKMSLYKTLERLQSSDLAGEKVVKRGRRRSYTYALAIYHEAKSLFDNTQFCQIVSNSANPDAARLTGTPCQIVSNRPNPDSVKDTSAYLTKKSIFSSDASGSIIDQSVTPLDCASLIDDRSASPNTHVSNRGVKRASNPDTASVLPIGQVLDTIGQDPPNPDSATVPLFDTLLDKIDQPARIDQTGTVGQCDSSLNLPEKRTPIEVAIGDSWAKGVFLREWERMVLSPKSRALEVAWYVELADKQRMAVPVDCIRLVGGVTDADG